MMSSTCFGGYEDYFKKLNCRLLRKITTRCNTRQLVTTLRVATNIPTEYAYRVLPLL